MKKRFLELLIRSCGLTPQNVQSYRTDGCGGQYEIGVGWMGEGVDEDGEEALSFEQPDGFNDAVAEILKFVQEYSKEIKIKTDWEFKI